LAHYWGKERLLISRNDANRYSYLLTAADLDDLVRFGPWSFVVPDGVGPAQSQSVVRCAPTEFPGAGSRHLELQDLRTFYQQGKTILLNSMQLRLPSVAALGRGLEQALQCPVNVNMYLTPPGARGFSAHFDDHDVFICQLEGTKIWRFYESGRELPVKFEMGTLDDNLTAEPIGECRLCPGDLLYLPRGVGHAAFTEDERSLHLTIGAGVVRWADLLDRAVACLSRKEVALREALPIGWVGDHKTRNSMRGQFRQLLQMLADQALLDDGLRDLSIRFVDALCELPDGSLVESSDLADLDM
jgi:ribosomal protein L16 Arg81 hydroxylase